VFRMFFISNIMFPLTGVVVVIIGWFTPVNPAPARFSAPTAPWVTPYEAPLGLTKDLSSLGGWAPPAVP
jgi:hypothetical protein